VTGPVFKGPSIGIFYWGGEGVNLVDINYLKTVSWPGIDIFFRALAISKRFSPMSLTKDYVVKALAKENGYHLTQSVELIETLLEIIKSKLASGEDVLISGFGKFCVREKRERRGRNPAKGDSMILRPRKVVTFKCSGQLRGRINKTQ